MIVSELITQLMLLPQDQQICILDYKENQRHDYGEGSKAGIYVNFKVYEISKDDVPDNSPSWVAIEFENETTHTEDPDDYLLSQ